ncbi:hypothetical protein CONPUDRAFT_169583 [Coniophora puteana RWD-64-598 SS2]|uniref:Uncharacterized protein n=1 Tax=Coniophora puteana (strain RWD-64-598) TaxID=741705 RepID=A0A5M3M8R3_CONPW|nr:uncharacterized protein CONPUDRAFT_169583 [Coniophora puteana RWD-64-598 SS2]EIW75180.1 hypothetical protein CONPUDRAFT_169583 [Coniophora puteana RWD-64-598 SS2]
MDYNEASRVVTEYIKSPTGHTTHYLRFLQALIVELDVRDARARDFPRSVTAAKKMIKAEIHINIKSYYHARGKGQAAIVNLKYPSKAALQRALKEVSHKKRAGLGWVKDKGLQVLLVLL